MKLQCLPTVEQKERTKRYACFAISGFLRGVNVVFALLGCYTA